MDSGGGAGSRAEGTDAGTTGTDRVIVYVTYANGATYKIYDNVAPFQSLNPY